MASTLSTLSASVTRILSLTGFPKELRTKDIHSAFSEWENANGGFKIKWKDDTSLFIVFQDAAVAKRAYLHTVAFPPPILSSPNGTSASIRPYDGPDAQAVILSINARSQSGNLARHNIRSASISTFPNGGHGRDRASSSSNNNNSSGGGGGGGGGGTTFYRNGREGSLHLQMASTGSTSSIPEPPSSGGGYVSSSSAAREPSPTLPNLPSHPTLNALINSSLSEVVTQEVPTDPAILSVSMDHPSPAGGPRIGDPGKRMLGAALGVRHPSLGPRTVNGSAGSDPVQRGLGALTVSE